MFRTALSQITRLREQVASESFLVSPRSIMFSPVFIIRRGLFNAIKQLAPEITGNLLDFGCGSKPYESIFSNATSYVGVDIEVSGHSHLDSKVDVFYDGKTLPFPDAQFDSIVSFEVFEHVFNPDELFTELNRVLKPGGKILISVPFAWGEHEQPYDYARYTSFGASHLLAKNDFRVVNLVKTTSHYLAISQLFIAYVSHYCLPRSRDLGFFSQLAVIFPLTAFALLWDKLLPKSSDYFANTVILAEKQAI